ncbi:terminase large subunit domain-containing protein [Brevibacillus laterosporus]|uniref:terminase large subunit domain-containing protein n=1 Tax=Brevibacillus laterosporus TaxID=1465 RepID=UPI0035A630B9
MAGTSKFQVDRNKHKKGISDIYKKSKKVNNSKDNLSKNDKLREGFKRWTAYFRANPHRFCSEYLSIKLHLFQKILIYMAFHVDFFMYLASRGQGKSWLIAVICCVRCILYPNSKIILASGTKGQARLIITQKIAKDLQNNYPNLAREIKDIKTSANECVVTFQNGSTIEAVTSTDNARGYRGNILVLDEFRLISEDNLNRILRPFLNVNRQPPYLTKPEYKHLQEENKEIYISSAWYKNHWIWDKFKSFANSMMKGRSYFSVGFPYQLSVFHGLLSKKRVEQMKSEDDFDPITWLMEMDCLFWGESEKAFYKLDDFQQCRTLVKPFYPTESLDFLQNKNKRRKNTKQDGEIRLISVDVAMMGGNENDNTIFTHIRLLPNGETYTRQVPYIESLNGQHSEKQAIRLKQLFYDFEADYVVMDTAGNGLNLYDDCSRVLYDEERDVEYEAWCAFNSENMKSRSLERNALPVIFSIKVTTQQLNHEIAMGFRNALHKKKIKLLQTELEGKEFLISKMDFDSKTPEVQAKLLRPYIQTTALVNETVNLEYETRNGYIKVFEVGSNRKDRYSSISYGNYFADLLEKDLKEDEYDEDDELVYYD